MRCRHAMTRLETPTGQHRAPKLERVRVLANDRVAEGVGLLVLHAPLRAPRRSARAVRAPARSPRAPTSSCAARSRSTARDGERIEILYQVLGTGTRALSPKAPGDEMDLVGPLGHGWTLPEGTAHALLVAGGLGAAPLGMLAEELAERGVAVTVALGAPTRRAARGARALRVASLAASSSPPTTAARGSTGS